VIRDIDTDDPKSVAHALAAVLRLAVRHPGVSVAYSHDGHWRVKSSGLTEYVVSAPVVFGGVPVAIEQAGSEFGVA
jgi:hypothetical protein